MGFNSGFKGLTFSDPDSCIRLLKSNVYLKIAQHLKLWLFKFSN